MSPLATALFESVLVGSTSINHEASAGPDFGGLTVSINAYCIRNKLPPYNFCRWKKKIQQSLSSQLSPSPDKEPSVKLENLLQDFFVSVTENAGASPTSFLGSQKLEIIFAQGHHFCLEGPFDWEKLSSWLTPLLTDPNKEPLETMGYYDNKNKLS